MIGFPRPLYRYRACQDPGAKFSSEYGLDPTTEITVLIKRGNAGDVQARERAVTLLHHELHRLAKGRAYGEGETLRPTALVNEAFLKLFGRDVEYQNRNQLLAHAALAMRQIVLHKAERAKAQKRGGPRDQLTLEDWDGSARIESDYLDLHEALAELERIQPRYAQILMLAFFAGFKNEQISEVLEISERTVYRDRLLAKAWLRKKLAAAGASPRKPGET